MGRKKQNCIFLFKVPFSFKNYFRKFFLCVDEQAYNSFANLIHFKIPFDRILADVSLLI